MFNSDQFKTAWSEWKEYLQLKTHSNYNAISERKALAALWQRCGGREDLAIASIDYSIEKNWNAVYLKPISNGNGQTNGSSQSFGGKQGGTSTNRMEELAKW